jgi:uncharacterized cupin superfamily protein
VSLPGRTGSAAAAPNLCAMARESFLTDELWDEVHDEHRVRSRSFGRPPGSMMGASLHELLPGSPGFRLHMHYGAEEMFFVLSGRPILRNGQTEEQLEAGDVVFCAEGRAGLHTFTNPTGEPVRILAVSAGRFPDVVAYPEHGYAWVATRDPELPPPAGGDPGIIARFGLPAGDS